MINSGISELGLIKHGAAMGNGDSTTAFYSARPRIFIDGQEQPGLADGLLTLLAEEDTKGLFRCEATFGNWGPTNGEPGYLYFDRTIFDFGRTLVIRAGHQDSEGEIFRGRIMALEGNYPDLRPPEITILAEDRFQDLRMTRRTRTFSEMSDNDIINQIASQQNLRTEIDLDGPTYPVLAQVNQSDLAFLRDRARAADFELWVEGDVLHAQDHARRNAGDVTLVYGERLQEFSALADLADQCTSLAVSGWDVDSKEEIVEETRESAISPELNGDQSGVSLLQQAYGSRVERIVHLAPCNVQEARALSKSHYCSRARRFVTARGVCEGDARIRTGVHLDVQGVGQMFNGLYYVTSLQHIFSEELGYQTRFSLERPGMGQH